MSDAKRDSFDKLRSDDALAVLGGLAFASAAA